MEEIKFNILFGLLIDFMQVLIHCMKKLTRVKVHEELM